MVTAAALAVVTLVAAAAAGAAPVAGAAAIALLVPAAVVDVEQRRLPDLWVGAALVVLVTARTLASAIGQPAVDISDLVGGSSAMALPVLALHLVSPAWMGFGDVKAAAVLGAAVGTVDWRLGAVALCVAALSGAVVGLGMRLRTIAFGPFLVFGAWCSLLGHDAIVEGIFTGGATP